jgi:hypothetical protein
MLFVVQLLVLVQVVAAIVISPRGISINFSISYLLIVIPIVVVIQK